MNKRNVQKEIFTTVIITSVVSLLIGYLIKDGDFIGLGFTGMFVGVILLLILKIQWKDAN